MFTTREASKHVHKVFGVQASEAMSRTLKSKIASPREREETAFINENIIDHLAFVKKY